ncbi:MAG: DUF5916 domain-containing protein [Candidatus Eisenbacteria bacterium]
MLDEPVWQSADLITAFKQRDPDQGAAPRQRTEARIAYDNEAIYIAAWLYDTTPDSIVARLGRRDGGVRSDMFVAFLDPFHDKRTGYYFGVSAAGTLIDGTLYNDGWDDDSWDAVWQAQVKRDSKGWYAEMKIPFSQVRFNSSADMVWGVSLDRRLVRSGERASLSYAPRGQSGFNSLFPELHGLKGIQAKHTVELIPYITGKGESVLHDADDPFRDNFDTQGAIGGDLRTGLGANLTLNATMNPDFGQVEIDPAQVNLSDVETFFDEKRPFFVEGSSVFRAGNNGANDYWNFHWPEPIFFYPRRIGRAPQGDTPAADFAQVPLAAHILGAAKVTGQPAKGWNFGTLHALTGQEDAKLSTGGVESTASVEPFTYYGVLRGMREFNDRRQGLGLMTTAVARRFESDDALDQQLNRSNLVTTLDGWTFLDKDRTYVLSGWAAGTSVSGTRERITRLQRSSAHYYQRPDVDYLGVDTSATSLGGYGARVWLNKQNGKVLLNTALGMMSPGFDNNDLGFLFRNDVINSHFGLGYQWNDPKGIRQYANVITALYSGWNTGGIHTSAGVHVGGNVEFTNRYSLNGDINASAALLSDRRTRGGPLMRSAAGLSGSVYFDTDGNSRFFYSLSVQGGGDAAGGSNFGVKPSANWKALPNLTFSLGPEFNRSRNDAQYVKRVTDDLATNTYGSRYVFAELDQTTFAAQLRVDYAITPALSFQVYAQPLVSSGSYTGYKELAKGSSYDFVTYGVTPGSTYDPATGTADPDGAGPAAPFNVGNPDFTFRTVRGNAVLRWEYLPGSAAYLVWTQERTDRVSEGRFSLDNSLTQLARAPANNVFLVKVSHHFEL